MQNMFTSFTDDTDSDTGDTQSVERDFLQTIKDNQKSLIEYWEDPHDAERNHISFLEGSEDPHDAERNQISILEGSEDPRDAEMDHIRKKVREFVQKHDEIRSLKFDGNVDQG